MKINAVLKNIIYIWQFDVWEKLLSWFELTYSMYFMFNLGTIPPPIKFLQHEMIQWTSFVTLLNVWKFTRVSVLSNWFIFVSTKFCIKKFSKFSPVIFLVLWSCYLKESVLRRFLKWKIPSVRHPRLVYLLASYS